MTQRKNHAEAIRHLTPARRRRLLARMDADTLRGLDESFDEWAMDGQRPPPGDWRVWLIMAGRGFGKTRAGAEWVTKLARKTGRTRIALVAATLDEARKVMVEGPSGLLACADPKRPPKWEPSRGLLSFRSGAQAFVYSAENPDGLRGPEHRYAWCDEVGKWARGEDAWMNLMMGLREGPDQRVLATTTPRQTLLLRRLLADPKTVRSGGRTRDNLHLSDGFVEAVEAQYAGTRLGRQELDGELIEDAEGALWTREMVEAARARPSPSGEGMGVGLFSSSASVGVPHPNPSPEGEGLSLVRVVVGVDPPASSHGEACCGIVAAGIDAEGVGHVLEDASVEQPGPERWAGAVSACASRWGADRVIAEANNGGDMVLSVLKAHDSGLPVTLVHASRGKVARAEPVALLYSQGRVKHHGVFAALEEELCGLVIGGGYEGPGRSPDRADALVWALTELMLRRRGEPRISLL